MDRRLRNVLAFPLAPLAALGLAAAPSVANAQGYDCGNVINSVSGFTTSVTEDPVDINGDGQLDAITYFLNTGLSSLYYWDNTQGDGTAWSAITIQLFDTLKDVAPADVDGDGDVDIFYTQHLLFDDKVAWLNNTGSGGLWGSTIIEDDLPDAASPNLTPFDADGDGDTDLLYLAGSLFGSGALSWYENTGSGATWTKHPIPNPPFGATSFQPGDFDGDGDTDLATSGPNVGWFENNGGGTSWTFNLLAVIDLAREVDVADMNGDGTLDILASDVTATRLFYLSNDNGDGSSWSEVDVSDSTSANDFAAFDMDSDGDMDVLTSSLVEVLWYENTAGDGSAWEQRKVADVESTFGIQVHPGDLDGDGRGDAISNANVFFVGGTIEAFVSVAPSTVTTFGCGVNPVGSLVVEGTPTIGQTLTVKVKDPTGAHPSGSPSFLALHTSTNAVFPCGTVVPGLGMGSPGALGEVLIDLGNGTGPVIAAGPVYDGVEAAFSISLPNAPVLVGLRHYAQGALFDVGPLGIGLTEGVEVLIGEQCPE